VATGDGERTTSEFDQVYSIVYEVVAGEFDARVIGTDRSDERIFFLKEGSARASVTVRQLDSGRVIVRIRAVLAEDVEATPELFSYIATHADAYYEGHLHLWPCELDAPRYSIHLSNDMFGTQVTPAGVRDFIRSLALKADSVDDELRRRFG
jgi:hypothetical protein